MAGTRIELGELHSLLTQELRRSIEYYQNEDEPIPASLVKEIAKFLQDNGIEAVAEKNPDLRALANDIDYGFDDSGTG